MIYLICELVVLVSWCAQFVYVRQAYYLTYTSPLQHLDFDQFAGKVAFSLHRSGYPLPPQSYNSFPNFFPVLTKRPKVNLCKTALYQVERHLHQVYRLLSQVCILFIVFFADIWTVNNV